MPEGSNQSPLTRFMLVAERLTSLGYMQVLFDGGQHGLEALARTMFITDGPLGLHGSRCASQEKVPALPG